MSDVLDLPFDQYQRYRLVSTLVEELRGKGAPLEILDVGGRTALLRRFLRGDRVTLVDLEASDEPRLVLGDGSALPFADQSFDLVCAFDTLEHVPPPRRTRFLEECARVARRWVVLAGPYQSEEVEEAEKLLQQFLEDKLGVHHRYLDEHRHHGLPERAATEAQLEKCGARVVSLGHGNVQRWLALISLSLYMDHTPALQAHAARLQRFYNRGLFADDLEPPFYRHAVVAALGDARLPRPQRARAQPRAPARELVHFAQELAAFDARRDGFEAETGRLQGVIRDLAADLGGHRDALQELVGRVERYEGLLQEHREVLAARESELEQHAQLLRELRAQLAELDGERAKLLALREQERSESDAVRGELEGELTALRRARDAELAELSAVRAELLRVEEHVRAEQAAFENELRRLQALQTEVQRIWQSERRDFEGVVAAREAEIGRRVELQRALAHELEQHRLVLGQREVQLEEHRAALADLRQDLDGHRALVATQQAELEQRAAALAQASERDGRTQAELANARDQLADLRAALERARGEIAAAAAELEAKERLIGLLRADLKSRLSSMRRAFGPARPTAGE